MTCPGIEPERRAPAQVSRLAVALCARVDVRSSSRVVRARTDERRDGKAFRSICDPHGNRTRVCGHQPGSRAVPRSPCEVRRRAPIVAEACGGWPELCTNDVRLGPAATAGVCVIAASVSVEAAAIGAVVGLAQAAESGRTAPARSAHLRQDSESQNCQFSFERGLLGTVTSMS